MTIKKSLILSYLAVCIFPFLMTLFVLISALGGLYFYAQSGNHIMAESDFQFSVVSKVIQTSIFHNLRHGRAPEENQWAIEMIDPIQTYVVLYEDDQPIYRYGNSAFQYELLHAQEKGLEHGITADPDGQWSYSLTRNDRYTYLERYDLHGHTYYLYVLGKKPVARSDAAIEKAFHATTRFIFVSLIFFILLTSYLLSRFIVHRLLRPLNQLKTGAEEIQNGNLDVHLSYQGNDEFTPAIRAFNLMSAKLAESLRQKAADEEKRKELVASISHDIRTPLTSIKAYVEGLLDHVANTPERQERYLRVIQKKADVLERLIEQLFLLSKMDLGEKTLPLEHVNLSDFVRNFIEENKQPWERSGARFAITASTDFYIAANTLLLGRILQNLVTNSIKYKIDTLVQIHLTLQRQGKQILLTFADDGPGVPEEALDRLQEAFYRTDKARSQTENGSGLGLAIVDRAVKLMQGTIAMQNAQPHGLAIQITFPEEEAHE